MRKLIRRGALSALLAIWMPGASLLQPSLARADDKITLLARQNFLDGVSAFDAKHYGEARDLFLQAYAMKRHPVVLLNLGLAEVLVGDPDSAASGANHLQQFLREVESPTAAQTQDAKNGIAGAKKHSAYIFLVVDVDGAKVLVDGQEYGKSPLTEPVFVKPGTHDVEAQFEGRVVRIQVQARMGALASGQLNLRTGATEALPEVATQPEKVVKKPQIPAPPKVEEEPVATPTDEPNRWGNDVPPPDNGPYMNPGYNLTPGVRTPEASPQTEARIDIVHWLEGKPEALTALSIGAGLGLLGTIGFGIGASNAKSTASDVTATIVGETKQPSDPSGVLPPNYYTATGSPIPCGSVADPSTAHPYYATACAQLRTNIKAHDTDIALMATSLVLTTVSIGGTLVWYYLDSNAKTGTAPKDAGAQAFVTVVPLLSPHHQGLGLQGTF